MVIATVSLNLQILSETKTQVETQDQAVSCVLYPEERLVEVQCPIYYACATNSVASLDSALLQLRASSNSNCALGLFDDRAVLIQASDLIERTIFKAQVTSTAVEALGATKDCWHCMGSGPLLPEATTRLAS